MIAAAAVHVGLLLWESQREEQHLLRVHGNAYARYRATVGRFIPRSVRPFQAKRPGEIGDRGASPASQSHGGIS
jgi:hypothetical protein